MTPSDGTICFELKLQIRNSFDLIVDSVMLKIRDNFGGKINFKDLIFCNYLGSLYTDLKPENNRTQINFFRV